MPAIDFNKLIADIEAAATGILNKDVTTMGGFSKTQTTAMATQAGWIASGTLSGSLTPDLRDYFLNNLKTLAQNFANALVGLLAFCGRPSATPPASYLPSPDAVLGGCLPAIAL
jgi:hypothetical protein